MLQSRVARDGEEFAVRSNGGDWLIAWHSPIAIPQGKAHGANGFCVTADDGVVLISDDGERDGSGGRSRAGALCVAGRSRVDAVGTPFRDCTSSGRGGD